MTEFEGMDINLLKEICETPGVSGFEFPILDLFKKILKKYTNDVINLNRVIRAKFGNEKGKILIVTSIDEPGFLIKKLNKKNKAEFVKIRSLDDRIILDKYVLIYDESYSEIGKIGLKKDLKDKKKVKDRLATYKDMIIETDYRNTNIRPGLPASFYSPVEYLNKPNMVVGKALCNRCCSFVTFELLKTIQTIKKYI